MLGESTRQPRAAAPALAQDGSQLVVVEDLPLTVDPPVWDPSIQGGGRHLAGAASRHDIEGGAEPYGDNGTVVMCAELLRVRVEQSS